MTEVAIPDRMAAVPMASLAEWAEEARAAASIAASVCRTSFVPRHFLDKPAEATAAILTGHELGLSPMASLRSIYVIAGTPAMYAIALRAVVQSKGHQVWVEEASPTRVVVAGRRAGTDQVQRSEWTVERAKQADLTGNAQYRKNPQNMLTARATVEVCRLIAADAILGIPYAVEEVDETTGAVIGQPRETSRVTAAEILGEIRAEPEPVEQAEQEWPETVKPADADA